MPAKLPPEGIYGVKGFRLFLQFVTNLNLVEELHFKEKPALSLSQGFDWGGLIYQFRLHWLIFRYSERKKVGIICAFLISIPWFLFSIGMNELKFEMKLFSHTRLNASRWMPWPLCFLLPLKFFDCLALSLWPKTAARSAVSPHRSTGTSSLSAYKISPTPCWCTQIWKNH